MIKTFLLFALVASVSALQDGPEAAPEPYSFSYQTDTHAAAEQKDPAGRVTGYYTLADVDGRERRVEYVADENGFRAKVQTNEVGTKAENPANVEVQAAEPSPAQYAASAQYSAGAAAQYQRQTYATTGAYAPATANYAANYQQYAYRPYGSSSYYSSGAYPFASNGYGYGSNYNGAYGGYGSNYNGAYGGYGTSGYYAGSVPSSAFYSSSYNAPVGYYGSTNYAPTSGYYSYRTSSSGAVPAQTAGYTTTTGGASGYRYFAQPAGAVTTTSYRQTAGAVPAVGGVATYSTGFPAASNFGTNGVTSSSSSRSVQGSSNYIVLKKRDAETKQETAATSN